MQLKLEAAFARAFAFEAMGEHGQARTLYEHILAAIPGHPGALLCVARQHRRAGELDAARACLEQALEGAKRMALPPTEIWTELGDVRHATGAREAARAAYAQALEASPGTVAALIGLGNLAFDVGDFRAAEMHYREAVARAPSGMAWVNVAFALESQSRLDEAEAAADEGLRHASQLPEAWQVRASVAFRRGDLTRAEEFCRQGLERFPEQAELLHLLGRILRRAGEVVKAREVLVRAASAAPLNTDILVTLAGISMALGRIADARLELARALELGASSVEVFDNLGLICEAEGDLPAALEAYARAVARGPTTTSAIANYARALRIACDFERAEVAGSQLLALTDDPSSDPRCPPMVGIFMGASAAQQVTIARRWCENRLPRVAAPLPIRSRGTRLRVGYISSDFRDHPTAHLIAGLFECHDPSRVETFGYGTVADDDSAIGRRIRGAFQHWCKLPAARHESNAERIRADSLDVLVDLNGHTRGSRLVVLARRPAPVQIHYMGFPGTIGYEAIEAIVADDIVAPPGAEAHHTERLIRLPRCFLVTDGSRVVAPRPARTALGLPDAAVVLVSFNQTHKLTRAFFDVWLDVLAQVPAAVLWLWAPHALAQKNLREYAARRGIGAERLFFATRVPQAEHIARLRAADLALDVLPYGSHTTGVDALWAGVPMLTCRGDAFAGRVGASLLHATGLDELITEDLEAYRAALIALASDPERLAAYRHYLDRERARLPLFDTEGFTRDWEDALESLSVRGGVPALRTD